MTELQQHSSEPLFEESAGAVLVTFVDTVPQFLLLRSKKGFWGIAKGHRKIGESLYETACREVLEETSITLYPVAHFFTHVSYFTKFKTIKTVYAYLGIIRASDVRISDEHTDFVFARFEELNNYLGEHFVQYELFVQARNYLSESNGI
jgi:8-oxo-dGTP pyrophosphatase MutT (NUDIX family)